jgi:hypothetical protein
MLINSHKLLGYRLAYYFKFDPAAACIRHSFLPGKHILLKQSFKTSSIYGTCRLHQSADEVRIAFFKYFRENIINELVTRNELTNNFAGLATSLWPDMTCEPQV